MIFLVAIICLLDLAITVYFIAVFHERSDRAARDINAIANRLRIQEDSCHAHEVAYDFRIKVLENQFSRFPDTGFSVRHLMDD